MRVTLETILRIEKEHRQEDGEFGIKACKESIEFTVRYFKKSLYQLLEEYVLRANESAFFNRRMVLACWELINEQ
jgi:hypothetical protein